jgi:hypothetical protein
MLKKYDTFVSCASRHYFNKFSFVSTCTRDGNQTSEIWQSDIILAYVYWHCFFNSLRIDQEVINTRCNHWILKHCWNCTEAELVTLDDILFSFQVTAPSHIPVKKETDCVKTFPAIRFWYRIWDPASGNKKKMEGTTIYMVIQNRNEQESLTYVYFNPSDWIPSWTYQSWTWQSTWCQFLMPVPMNFCILVELLCPQTSFWIPNETNHPCQMIEKNVHLNSVHVVISLHLSSRLYTHSSSTISHMSQMGILSLAFPYDQSFQFRACFEYEKRWRLMVGWAGFHFAVPALVY